MAVGLNLSEKLNDRVGEAEGRVEELVPRQIRAARSGFQKRLRVPTRYVGLAREFAGRVIGSPSASLTDGCR